MVRIITGKRITPLNGGKVNCWCRCVWVIHSNFLITFYISSQEVESCSWACITYLMETRVYGKCIYDLCVLSARQGSKHFAGINHHLIRYVLLVLSQLGWHPGALFHDKVLLQKKKVVSSQPFILLVTLGESPSFPKSISLLCGT